jgi:1,4-dihydroxy-2-naphthoate octaprenyltransferase
MGMAGSSPLCYTSRQTKRGEIIVPIEEQKRKLDLRAGIWRLADPKISLASLASMFLGACASVFNGGLSLGWLALTVLGIFCIEVAKNASGEIFDFDSGTDQAIEDEDRSPFSGGKRVLVDGLLTRRHTIVIAAAGYVLGVISGALIFALREPKVFWTGLMGVACAYFYHAPPFKLSYRGLGELAVGICYGPLICAGTYLVQRGAVTREVVLLSLPLGLLIANFLWINEFPDYRADLSAKKMNLVVRLGRQRAARVFVGVTALAGVGVALLPLTGLPKTVWFGMVFLIPAAKACRVVVAHSETTAQLIPAQAMTLLSFLLTSAGSGIGLLLGSWR